MRRILHDLVAFSIVGKVVAREKRLVKPQSSNMQTLFREGEETPQSKPQSSNMQTLFREGEETPQSKPQNKHQFEREKRLSSPKCEIILFSC